MVGLTPYLARENSISDAVYTYLSCERIVLLSMRDTVVDWAKKNVGPQWHSRLKSEAPEESLKFWHSASDAFYILKCIAKLPPNLLSASLGSPATIRPLAKKVFQARNTWSHFSNQLLMNDIKQDVLTLRDFAEAADLAVAPDIDGALSALRDVTALRPSGPAAPDPTDVSKPSADQTERPRRPRIGDPWFHSVTGDVWDVVPKLRDIKKKTTGESLSSRWENPEEGAVAVRRLLRRGLSPRLLYIDEHDGAAVGYIDGRAYFLGYMGTESTLQESQVRGFYERESFEFVNGDLVESETAEPAFDFWEERGGLVSRLQESGIEEGAFIRVTDFGDLVVLGESGAKTVAQLPSSVMEQWWDESGRAASKRSPRPSRERS